MRLGVAAAAACAASASATPAGFSAGSLKDSADGLVYQCESGDEGGWWWTRAAAVAVSVPAERLNDGYCDCPGGGDEPATGACSGRPFQRPFVCPNDGYSSQSVPAWAVGDGVCDCCDGSDEAARPEACGGEEKCKVPSNSAWAGPLTAPRCPNTCEQLRLERETEKAERNKWLEGALKTRRGYIATAAEQLSDKESAGAKLPEEVAALEAEAGALEKEVAAMAEQESEQTAELRRKHEEEFVDTVAVADAELVSVVGRLALSDKERTTELLTNKLPHKDEIDDVELLLIAMEDEPSENAFVDLLRLSEMPAADLRRIMVEMLREGELFAELSKAAGRGNKWSGFLQFGEYPTYTNPLKSATSEKLKAVNDEKQQKQTQLDSLKETTGHDFGPDNVFYGVFKQCVKRQIGEHEYEVCPFSRVKQGWRDLGTWTGWGEGGYSVMKFGGGASDNCPGGVSRSSTVTLRCGIENRIVSVFEPEVCKYDFVFETPAACKEEDLQ